MLTGNFEAPVETLTKREYFAAMAMQALVSDHVYMGNLASEVGKRVPQKDRQVGVLDATIADRACLIADALVEALAKS